LDKQSSRYRSDGFVHEIYCTISLRNMIDMPDEERKRRRRRAAQEMVWRVEKVGGASWGYRFPNWASAAREAQRASDSRNKQVIKMRPIRSVHRVRPNVERRGFVGAFVRRAVQIRCLSRINGVTCVGIKPLRRLVCERKGQALVGPGPYASLS
jgi:hypothetical protein